MKNLFIIRHAKAELHSSNKKDFDRNLIDKGVDRAKKIALELDNQVSINDKTLFISSPANRAKQTAIIFADILNFPAEKIQYEPSIYEASIQDILKVINTIQGNYDTVLLFGHNPALSDFVNYCTDEYINLKTSACVQLQLVDDLDFSNLSQATAKLVSIISE